MYKIFTSIVAIIFLYKRKDLEIFIYITIFSLILLKIFFRSAKRFAVIHLAPLKKISEKKKIKKKYLHDFCH